MAFRPVALGRTESRCSAAAGPSRTARRTSWGSGWAPVYGAGAHPQPTRKECCWYGTVLGAGRSVGRPGWLLAVLWGDARPPQRLRCRLRGPGAVPRCFLVREAAPAAFPIAGHHNHVDYQVLSVFRMRKGEALALSWDRVDLDAGLLKVAATISDGPRTHCPRGNLDIGWAAFTTPQPACAET
jgi:hypothetical protein